MANCCKYKTRHTVCVCESYLAEHCLAIGTQPHSADYTMYILL